MSHLIVHTNPDIYAEPDKFKPERWLEAAESLDNYLVAFSRGPHQEKLNTELVHAMVIVTN